VFVFDTKEQRRVSTNTSSINKQLFD